VAGSIAGSDTAESAGLSRVRRRLAEIWHILAIVYIGAIYLAYALRVEGGSGFMLRATLVSLVVIVGARLLVRFIEQLSAQGFAVAPDLKARFPELEKRTNRYLPILTGLSAAGMYALAFLLVLQAWDVRSFAWFETGLGRQTAGALLSIGLVLAIALAVWELFSAAIERQLAGLDAHGAPSRARRRTLLPLLRTTLFCVIVSIAGLTILSQIGVSIAPLLAGAGVVGVAVGFGSQALVKDVITGLFILVEDQVAVGDVVDLGKEHKGVVEAISVRTIRLRDQTGAVHTVPFSEVTTVKNMTKDFAYAVEHIAELGARNVVITNESGCFARLREGRKTRRYRAVAPQVEAVSSVGSGDVLLAAFIGAHAAGRTTEEALREGVAAGAASTREVGAGRFDPKEAAGLEPDVEVGELEQVGV